MIHDSLSPSSRSSIDPDLLLAQSSWVEALARTLVRDPFGAEDVFQETMLAALEAPPRDVGDVKRLRAWLGRVAYNLAHLSLRRSYRRRAREEWAARDDVARSTADQVAQTSVLNQVVETVEELEEPYRSTVLKRYFEGKSTAQIAAETNTTDNAVRKRLWRARAKLRGSLDRVHNGDRLAWFAALCPLVGIEIPGPLAGIEIPASAPTGAAASGSGAGAGATVKSIAASPLLWAGGLLGLALLATVTESPVVAAAHPESVGAPDTSRVSDLIAGTGPGGRFALGDERGQTGGEEAQPPSGDDETLEGAEDANAADEDDPAGAGILVHGLVIDLDGTPLPNVCITAQHDPQAVLGWSAADGTFEAVLPEFGTSLLIEAPGYATVRSSLVNEKNVRANHVLVAGRTVSLAGTVIDEAGAPLPKASVVITASEAAFTNIEVPLNLSTDVSRTTIADETGHFAFEDAITGSGIYLCASREGFESTLRGMPAADDLDLTLTLHRPSGPPTTLRGIVFYESDEPAPGAVVRLGRYQAVTDARGSFWLNVRNVRPGDSLRAFKPGYLPAELEGIGSLLSREEEGGTQVGLELQLGGEALALSGHVYDPDGSPLAAWRVSTLPANGEDEDGFGVPINPSPGILASTGEDGGFVVYGLEAADYYVQAHDPETLLTVRAGPFRAGSSGLTLQVDEDAWRENFEGRVRDEFGNPLAGATVTVALVVQAGGAYWREYGLSTMTDGYGNFAYATAPRDWIEYRVEHPSTGDEYHNGPSENGGGDDDGGVEFDQRSSCYFRLETTIGHMAPDTFAVFDRAGHELRMTALGQETMRGRIMGGHTLVHEVGFNAHSLVLYRGDEEAGTTVLELIPGEVVTIHPTFDDSRNDESDTDTDTGDGSLGDPD